MAAVRILTLVPALVLMMGSAAWAAPATDAVLAEAQAALDKGDAIHARNLAQGALGEGHLAPGQRGRLLLDLGLADELLGSHADALVDFTQAVNSTGLPKAEQAEALLQRGFLLDSLGRLDDAAGDYSAVIRLTPAAPAALNNRANVYRRQNKLAEARRDYMAALALDNPHPEYPWSGLGQLAEAQGDLQAARGYYAKAVTANPAYGPAGERLAALGGPPDAAIADPGIIHLHPPGAPVPADAPVTLKPPASVPQADSAPTPMHLHLVRRPSAPPADPLLRPALDPPQSGSMVQLGAWRSEAQAQAGWQRAASRAPAVLGTLSHVVVTADLPAGRYYRLQVSPGADGAGALCRSLSAQGVDCILVRN